MSGLVPHALPGGNNRPPAWPILGHAPSYIRDRLGFLTQCRQRYGDAVQLKIGKPVWLLNNPEDIQHILAINGRNYEKSPKLTNSRGRKLFGHGLLTATGEDHLPRRRQLQALYRRPVIENHARMIAGVVDRWISCWGTGDEICIFPEMTALSQKVMIKVLFGPGFEDPGGRFAAAVTTRRRYIEYFFNSNLPSPEHLPIPIVWKFSRAQRYLHAVIDAEIKKRRPGRDKSGGLLSLLISPGERGDYTLDDREVRDEAITITTTGYETIGAALAWTIHLLAKHPGVVRRVRRGAAGPARGPDRIVLSNPAFRLRTLSPW